MKNSITELLKIQYPILQGGMVWVSGWRLAAAVSNAGGLGIIGAGSMHPDVLQEHIRKCKAATNFPFGVNVPLLYPEIDKIMAILIQEKVPIVVSSAGNPNIWTKILKSHSITVLHVVSNVRFAQKAEKAGVDAIIAEGFEAGGHNGREENTTFTLIPMVCKAVTIPVIAAGGIATGQGMLAAMVLGASGVQLGTRFVASKEASAHMAFKKEVLAAKDGDTMLTLKELTPVRLLKNAFYQELQKKYASNASDTELSAFLGKGRAKKGMFLGDIEQGELEIGQIAGLVDSLESVSTIMEQLLASFYKAKAQCALWD